MVSIWIVTELGYVKQTLSCPVSCTHETNMPAAINAPANTYQFVVTVRHCVFLLPFFIWWIYVVLPYVISFAFFLKAPITIFCHFFVFLLSLVLQLYAIFT